jgi:small-conductance mechanosensitive channel/CRP-like cAMP-binding protein
MSIVDLLAASAGSTIAKLSASSAAVVSRLNPFWVFVLVIGFPLLMLLLEELLRTLRQRHSPYLAPLAILRNWMLPVLALNLVLVQLLGRPRAAIGVRLSETLIWITLILAALTLLNVILFEGAAQGSWQARVPKLFRDLGSFLLVLVGSAIVLSSVWGADLGGFLTALGVGSLVLGLALQDSLGNIFSGVALLFEQPIGMGDWIQIGDSLGKVVEVNWRSVHLQTTNDDLVVIPNAELAKGQFTNFSRPSPLHRLEIPIAFSYDDPPNRVRQLLINAALEIPEVLRQPAPNVVVVNYGDFSISYLLQIFASDFNTGENIRDEMNLRIWYVAKRHGLTMPYPVQQTLPFASAVVSPELQRLACLRLLRSTPGFAALPLDRLQQLLETCPIRAYAIHEIVLQQQSRLDGLYLILNGSAELLVADAKGRTFSLGVLLQGEFFGEKSSLLHGRVADTEVRACDDLEVLFIPTEQLLELQLDSPRLAADLAEVIEIRHRALLDLLAAHRPAPARGPTGLPAAKPAAAASLDPSEGGPRPAA